MSIARQARLDLCWRETSGFAGFLDSLQPGALATVQGWLADPSPQRSLLLAGPPTTGKSHLLAAAAGWAADHGRSHLLLAGSVAEEALTAGAADGVDVLLIDGIGPLLDRREAALALFQTLNARHDGRTHLLLAARGWPLVSCLPDLTSRLDGCQRVLLKRLDDAAVAQLLEHWARARGMRLPAHLPDYAMARLSRDPLELKRLLEELDVLSLEARRPASARMLQRIEAVARASVGPRDG